MLSIPPLSELAELAGVAPPATGDSPGAQYLQAVATAVTDELAEIGPSMHVYCLMQAADLAVPLDKEEAFATFVDLGLWDEGLPTTVALEAAGLRLGAALVSLAS